MALLCNRLSNRAIMIFKYLAISKQASKRASKQLRSFFLFFEMDMVPSWPSRWSGQFFFSVAFRY